MLKINLGSELPKTDAVNDIGLAIAITSPNKDLQEKDGFQPENTIFFKIKFIDDPKINHETEAKGVESAIKNLLLVSKSLHYLAKHIIEEVSVKCSVIKTVEGAFLIIELVITDKAHMERCSKIVQTLRNKEVDEYIRLRFQTTDLVGLANDENDKTPNGCFQLNTNLQQATLELIKQCSEEYLQKEPECNFLDALLGILLIKKLTIEAEFNNEVLKLMPQFESAKSAFKSQLQNMGGFKLPMTTSTKKIALILRDKFEANFSFECRVDDLSIILHGKILGLWQNFINGFFDL